MMDPLRHRNCLLTAERILANWDMPGRSPVVVPIIACKRCRLKKLKCDNDPKVCQNCAKAEIECHQVDSRSGREYRRNYIDELHEKIRRLREVVENSVVQAPETQQNHGSSSTLTSPTQTTYRGDGSVESMARLVEAAVTTPEIDVPLLSVRVNSAPSQDDALATRVNLAILPPRDVAEQLFSSYFGGLHLLHPFLHRPSLLRELNQAYTQQETLSASAYFRIHMVFAIGSVSLVRERLHNVSPVDYYASAMQHFDKASGLSSLEHIQALLLILLFSLQNDVGIGSKWDLARVAMRICIENNFHKKAVKRCDLMTEQMQRRVFWACYISDRHSSSVLNVPMAIQDEDITAEFPIDADDDLIESGNIDAQLLRGMSEVSAQLRQIRLRKITSMIGTRLYRTTANRSHCDLRNTVDGILHNLQMWHDEFPVLAEPRNIYEHVHWRDLNYYRERLKCFRLLMLARKDRSDEGCLKNCYEAAAQVALLYQSIRTSDKLIMNWTCVHDMMSAGFTNLYCGIIQRDSAREEGFVSWGIRALDIRYTTGVILDTLSYIAEKWPPVENHAHVFRTLACRVDTSMMARRTGTEAWRPREASAAELAEDSQLDRGVDHHADMWDAAMAAFLDQPLDLGNIDWGSVDWDAMQLLNDE
ncbi:hypothetical protein NM208_g2186 [Fusarium decemcellulare]|uniref:Uncharacterized protein n=1 Tax=Fusarium decemcellulare TaxID=57161 RepID=A0ACC1STH2_9HYPO|nr:hypothetical protein NM208_g2186 [Fusarium decemcellulare]